ncbi:hypothetical protein Vretifemale_2391 [Volvox reticuliferus]|nr:hypothetical protein Vretifemale_2391 [Volvox reticuliferus]
MKFPRRMTFSLVRAFGLCSLVAFVLLFRKMLGARAQMLMARGARPLRSSHQMQQTRGMAGGEDDGVHRVNWWDAPANPDVWKKHQLAWWTVAAYTGVYWLVAGGSKKEEAK